MRRLIQMQLIFQLESHAIRQVIVCISLHHKMEKYKITSAGVKSEFYSGLMNRGIFDIDSSNGDVYVAEKAAGKGTYGTSGTSYQYATGQTLITCIVQHDATDDIYFVVG